MKYRIKKNEGPATNYTQICIICCNKKIYHHHEGRLPRPNTAFYWPPGNIVSCWLGSHAYYFEDEIEPVQ